MAVQNLQVPSIPEPRAEVEALLKTVQALKENIEILTGNRSKNTEGIANKLIDLESQTGSARARFTSFVTVQTTANYAMIDKTDIMQVEIDQNRAKITQVDIASVSRDEALASRITTLNADFQSAQGDVNAMIQQEATARANADGALAQLIDNISASGPDGEASGSIVFRATTGLAGIQSSWQLTLTAKATGGPEYSAGLFVGVDAATGLGVTVFTTDQFRFYSGSTGKTVFGYDGTWFTFNGNVRINGQLIVDGSVATAAMAPRSITNVQYAESQGQAVDTFLDIGEGSLVLILGTYKGNPGASYSTGLFRPGGVYLNVDGTDVLAVVAPFSTGSGTFSPQPLTTQKGLTLAPGVHRFLMTVDNNMGVGVLNLTVVEFKR